MVKYIIAILIVLFLAVFFIWSEVGIDQFEKEKVEIKPPDSQAEMFESTTVDKKVKRSRQIVMTEELAAYEARYNEIRSEVPAFKYSDDWMVEMYTLQSQSAHCSRNGMYHKKTNDLNEMQQKLADEVGHLCEEYAMSFEPFQNRRIKWRNLVRAESEAGQRLQQAIDPALHRNEFLPLFSWAYRNKSHHILAGSLTIFNRREQMPDIAEILSSEHQAYNKMTANIATNLLACQMSASVCQPNAPFMYQQCLLEDIFCGMDFNDWYLKHVPMGQQKDVALIVDWIKEGVE